MAKFKLEEKNVWPPKPTMEELIKVETDKVDFIISKKILAGFDYEVDGETYHFSYDASDQSNFSLMCNSAAISLQLGNMTEEQRKAAYGDDLPTALPSEWKTVWQGWKDGVSHSLVFTLPEFLALAAAGGKHLQIEGLGNGWDMKSVLRACTTPEQLNQRVAEIELDKLYRLARGKKISEDIEPVQAAE